MGVNVQICWGKFVNLDGASSAMIAPFCDPELVGDFTLPRVRFLRSAELASIVQNTAVGVVTIIVGACGAVVG